MSEDNTIESDGISYHWKECIHDFAGNSRQNGFWADVWESPDGAQAVTCGGDWISYFPGFKAKENGALDAVPWNADRFMEVRKAVWEGYSYPHPLAGDQAKKMIELINENPTSLAEAIAYLESLSNYEEPEMVSASREPV